MLSNDTIPLKSKDVVHRNDVNGVLLFQVRTDEMHFVPKEGWTLLQLCDGAHSLQEIESLVVCAKGANADARTRIENFLLELEARHLIEIWR